MTKVKDLVLYQIATDRNYKVGDKIEFGKEFNGQMERLLSYSFHNGNIPFFQEGFNALSNKDLIQKNNIIEKLSDSLYKSDFVIRELAIEDIRKNFFPNLPSRIKCMYLSEEKDEVIKNLKIFKDKVYGTFFQAIAVKLNGTIFKAKEVYFPRLGFSYSEYQDLAKKYWSQNQNSKEKTKEILFEGTAEIVEIFDEYKVIKK